MKENGDVLSSLLLYSLLSTAHDYRVARDVLIGNATVVVDYAQYFRARPSRAV